MDLFLSDLNKSFEDLAKAKKAGPAGLSARFSGSSEPAKPKGTPSVAKPPGPVSQPKPKPAATPATAKTGSKPAKTTGTSSPVAPAGAQASAPAANAAGTAQTKAPGDAKPKKGKNPAEPAASPGSELVDCPLGDECPDKQKGGSGKHHSDSTSLKEHAKQAQNQGQKAGKTTTGTTPTVSTPADTAAKVITPETANVGTVGSDQVPGIKAKPSVLDSKAGVGDPAENKKRKDLVIHNLVDRGRNKLAAKDADKFVKDLEDKKLAHDKAQPEYWADVKGTPIESEDTSKLDSKISAKKTKTFDVAPPNRTEAVKEATARESMSTLSQTIDKEATDSGNSRYSDKDKAALAQAYAKDPAAFAEKEQEQEQEQEDSPLSALAHSKANKTPPKPPEAQDSDGDLSALASSNKKEESAGTPEYEEQLSEAHEKQKERAAKVLKEAKETHENTKKQASETLERNKAAIDKHEKETKDYEQKKAAGEKKLSKPKKPKLEKEVKVPDAPELQEPKTDAEKLKHGSHTERAKATRENIESHLKNNPDIQGSDRKRLERAHAVASFHENIEHSPSAAHKSELSEAEKAASDLGVHEHWDDKKAREDSMAATEAEFSSAKEENEAAKQQLDEAKQAATAKKEAEKDRKINGGAPESDLDHAKMHDHAGKAQSLQENIQNHLASNPNVSPTDRAKAEKILAALDDHANMDQVPGSSHSKDLKDLQSMAGEMGKAPKESKAAGATKESKAGSKGTSKVSDFLRNNVRAGAGAAGGMAHAAVSPTGAGSLGQQVTNYGVNGAMGAGHTLLQGGEKGATQENYDKQKEQQKTTAPQPSPEAAEQHDPVEEAKKTEQTTKSLLAFTKLRSHSLVAAHTTAIVGDLK